MSKSQKIYKSDYFFLYEENKMKKSYDTLASNANISIREAYADITNLLAKMHTLYKIGEVNKKEVQQVERFAKQLDSLVDNFKYSIMR